MNFVLEPLQAQYNRERANEAFYLAMAAAFEQMNLTGFAGWARRAADEEHGHAQKFFDYIADLNAMPRVDALPVPALPAVGDVLSLFVAARTAEIANSDALVTLAQQALLATDLTTHAFVQPFLLEQVQSVRELDELTTKLALATGNGAALLLLEHELGEGAQ